MLNLSLFEKPTGPKLGNAGSGSYSLQKSLSGNGGPSHARHRLFERFSDRMVVDFDLARRLVSYQGNKKVSGFRWLKYKEGFSVELVERLLEIDGGTGKVLDPFSGIGTTALTASRKGRLATGIEIMPVGTLVAKSIMAIANHISTRSFAKAAAAFLSHIENGVARQKDAFPHVRITRGAFAPQLEEDIAKARGFIASVSDSQLAAVLNVACLTVIEQLSFTRKDGQYLRWDWRSGRTTSRRLDKGPLSNFVDALKDQLNIIAEDIPTIQKMHAGPAPNFVSNSCLDELKRIETGTFNTVVTSPPYANRYDYTRTYALELAYLGYDENGFKTLRQELLSATVENKSKREYLKDLYGSSRCLQNVFQMVDTHPALSEALEILRNNIGKLSNRNVIRLIENYFTEMAVVISELARVVKRGGRVFMVNDNVRYHGEEIPVDLILSDLAERLGFRCNAIWVLSRGKGNSSQQMGRFGRQEIRKCIYHWERA